MNVLPGNDFFLLGLAGGIALGTITAYQRLSPPWLKWLLIVSALLMVGRYLMMGLLAGPHACDRVWALRYCWLLPSASRSPASWLLTNSSDTRPSPRNTC